MRPPRRGRLQPRDGIRRGPGRRREAMARGGSELGSSRRPRRRRRGSAGNLGIIARIRDAVDSSLQLGGGIRTEQDIESALASGVDRVVLGTAAVNDRPFATRALERWREQVAIGLDARDGRVATSGWLNQTDVPAVELATELRRAGAATFIFTDIRRDGTLKGPNLSALGELVLAVGSGVIASGGVGGLDDVSRLVVSGVDGAIIGRALYDGRVDLAQAIALADQKVPS